MSPKKEGAAAVTTQTDPDRIKLNAAIPIEPSGKVQETIAGLNRDFVAEALRVVSVKASHAADDVELGDDVGAERGMNLIISHVKAAAAAFRELLKAGGLRRTIAASCVLSIVRHRRRDSMCVSALSQPRAVRMAVHALSS